MLPFLYDAELQGYKVARLQHGSRLLCPAAASQLYAIVLELRPTPQTKLDITIIIRPYLAFVIKIKYQSQNPTNGATTQSIVVSANLRGEIFAAQQAKKFFSLAKTWPELVE